MCNNIDVTKYLVSMGDGSGVGCLVGNKLVTAGHVVEMLDDPSFVYEGRTYHLNKDNAVLYSFMNDETFKTVDSDKLLAEGCDIAIFEVEGINSPLEFATGTQTDSDELTCATLVMVHTVDNNPELPELFRNESHLESRVCKVNIVQNLKRFLDTTTDYLLKKGNSGSPLLKDGKVAGILIAGEPETNKCVFQVTNI